MKRLAIKLTAIACATMLLASNGAWADDATVNVNLGGDATPVLSAHFGVTHIEAGDFTDTITFSPSRGDWTVDASLVTIGFIPATDINFYAADINGHAMNLTANGTFEYGWLGQEPVTGPLVLTVYGDVVGMGGAASASYAGTLNISPVPEPSTWGLLMGGMGIVAWLARRRVRD